MPDPRKFPDGFLWGTASAAHQVEGGCHGNDWWRFEQQGGILTGDSADPACDHYRRFHEDFRLFRELNLNAHRLSIEWSRVEPAEGEFDARELKHYREVLADLREQGQSPMVTLHHFTSPTWFADRGGWAAGGAPDAFLRFVERTDEALGDLVQIWCTINEPNIYAHNGWITGEFPPGRRGDVRGFYRVLANLRTAHERAYRLLKRRRPQIQVGLAHHKWLMLPADSGRRRDVWAAGLAQTAMDRWPVAGARLANVVDASSDYIGLNHYTGSLVAFDPFRPKEQFIRRFNPPGLPETDFGWAVEPSWLRRALEDLKPLGKPVYVSENGMATTDDRHRQRFLVDVLEQVWLAIQAGTDVRGYFHWTGMDNFEWARGYSMKFGLIAVDLKTQERSPKPSAALYAKLAAANALPD